MVKVEISFDTTLTDLLRLRRGRKGLSILGRDASGTVLEFRLDAPAGLKDLIESVGIPHCEIGAVGGDLSSSDGLVLDGYRVNVAAVQPFFLPGVSFLCDGHLGRLARWLRLLGFDTLWDPAWSEAEVARRGVNEGRTVLSRSRSLLKRRELTRAMLVRPDDPQEQVRQVATRFLLAGREHRFSRCSVCNGEIEPVSKAEVLALIPPKTAVWLDDYYRCTGCGKLYWEGTHADRLRAMFPDMAP